jgi:hypothetical protein
MDTQKFTLRGTFVVEKSNGSVNLNSLFPTGLLTIVDPEFAKILDFEGTSWSAEERLFFQLFEGKEMSDRDMIAVDAGYVVRPTYESRVVLFSLLKYLGNDGMAYLNIPDGNKITVGYGELEGIWYRLEIEHELKEGQPEQIHLHASRYRDTFKKPFLFFHLIPI